MKNTMNTRRETMTCVSTRSSQKTERPSRSSRTGWSLGRSPSARWSGTGTMPSVTAATTAPTRSVTRMSASGNAAKSAPPTTGPRI